MRSEHTTIPETLQFLIKEIEGCSEMNSGKLIDFIHLAKLQKVGFEPFSDFSHDPGLSYARTRLYEGQNFNIYLMSWAPGDFTAIHSHGETDWGAVVFFSGVSHRLYEVTDTQIFLKDKSGVPAGLVAPVNGKLVHAMGNLTEVPAMSLHIYGSNQGLSNANDGSFVYELEKKLIRQTHGEAYINLPDSSCQQTLKGLATDEETLIDYLRILKPFYRKNNMPEMCKYIDALLTNPSLYTDPEQYSNPG